MERNTFAYVMQPARVKLNYRGKSFVSIDLEIGYDELEATTAEPVELEMSDEVLELFAELGLPEPSPVRVLPVHHQISQKLHACSEPGSVRAHDPVDLQLLVPIADLVLVHETAVRLFAFRGAHAWPPTGASRNCSGERSCCSRPMVPSHRGRSVRRPMIST